MRIETKAKLDYLKGTKSAIADALVEKGQTVSSTDTFRSYADKVRAIKSGGGGLEPGVYFKRNEIPCHGKYYQYWMWFNGGLFCFRLPFTGNGSQYEIYKRTDNKWTKIVEKTIMYGLGNPININGKLHLVGFKNHCVFDGETITVLSDMPASNFSDGGRSAFLYEGKIHAFSFNVEYEWNESNDTWTLVRTHSNINAYNSVYTFTSNGEIYAFTTGKVYHYSSGTLTELASLSTSHSLLCVCNEVAYFIYRKEYSDEKSEVHIFDPSTALARKVGTYSQYGGVNSLCYSDTPTPNPYIIMGTNSGLACNEMIVVEDEG